MSRLTRSSPVFGVALLLAATALMATPAAAQDDVPQGGTIVVGEWQAAEQLHPWLSNAKKDTEGYRPAMRTLATVNDDGEFVPELLAEFPTLENGGLVLDDDGEGFTLNLTLQEGLAFSDGEPLTLHDFKWDYDWAIEIGASGEVGCPYCSQLVPLKDQTLDLAEQWLPENQRVDSFEVSEDGLTASIHFGEDFAGWITMLTEIPIMAKHYWENVPLEELATHAVVGSDTLLEIPTSGPFKIVAASTDGIDYEPNEFWAADSGPNLDQLRLRFFGSKDGMFASFLNGEIDLTLNTTLADVPALQSVDPSIGRARVATGWQYEHLDFNHERADKGLDDPVVRRALEMAIDKQTLLDVLFPGAGLEPACSNTPPSQWYAAEIERAGYDPEGAAALLDEAGWLVDPEVGTRVKDGNQMRIRACTSSGNPVRLTTLGRIAQDWAAIGVATDIQTESTYFDTFDLTTPDTECNIYRGTFDVALYTDGLSPDPYSDWFGKYHSSQPATEEQPSGINIPRVRDEHFDTLIDELGSNMTEEGIKDAALAIQLYIEDQTTEAPLYYRPEPTGISNHLGGHEGYNPSTATSLWDVEHWFFIE